MFGKGIGTQEERYTQTYKLKDSDYSYRKDGYIRNLYMEVASLSNYEQGQGARRRKLYEGLTFMEEEGLKLSSADEAWLRARNLKIYEKESKKSQWQQLNQQLANGLKLSPEDEAWFEQEEQEWLKQQEQELEQQRPAEQLTEKLLSRLEVEGYFPEGFFPLEQ